MIYRTNLDNLAVYTRSLEASVISANDTLFQQRVHTPHPAPRRSEKPLPVHLCISCGKRTSWIFFSVLCQRFFFVYPLHSRSHLFFTSSKRLSTFRSKKYRRTKKHSLSNTYSKEKLNVRKYDWEVFMCPVLEEHDNCFA